MCAHCISDNRHNEFPIKRQALSNTVLGGGLPVAAMIFTATEQIANIRPGSYTIFSDSESVLLALISNAHNSVMVTEICLLLYHAKTKEIYRFVLGIVGNENADSSAKSATVSVDRQTTI